MIRPLGIEQGDLFTNALLSSGPDKKIPVDPDRLAEPMRN